MRISARCEYTCKALLELSLHWTKKEPLPLHLISERQAIPVKFLVQILFSLKRLGLVKSSRGKDGGYNLAKPPNKIILGEVLRRIEEPVIVESSVVKNKSIFSDIWRQTDECITKLLDKITFDDIANKVKKGNKAIVYQI